MLVLALRLVLKYGAKPASKKDTAFFAKFTLRANDRLTTSSLLL